MKNLYLITVLSTLLLSCVSIEKMVDAGNYEDAFRYAVDHLSDHKHKKTKYVVALEEAYFKLNQEDLRTIDRLKLDENIRSMSSIINIYRNMEGRQAYIYDLLPLISEEGYVAEFEIVDYAALIKYQNNRISDYKLNYTTRAYKEALGAYNIATTSQDKADARYAYDKLNNVLAFYDDFKDVNNLKNHMIRLGMTRVKIETYSSYNHPATHIIGSIVSSINTGYINKKWTRYYTDIPEDEIDYVATIQIVDIDYGIANERAKSFTERKEIKRSEVVKGKDGKIKRDTLGNPIKRDVYKKVSAEVYEIERSQNSSITATIVMVDKNTNNHIVTIPINIVNSFADYSLTFTGDKRALSKRVKTRLKPSLLEFATRGELITLMSEQLRESIQDEIRNFHFPYNT